MLEQTKYCGEVNSVKDKASKQKITKEELSELAYYLNVVAEFTKLNAQFATPKLTPKKYKVN